MHACAREAASGKTLISDPSGRLVEFRDPVYVVDIDDPLQKQPGTTNHDELVVIAAAADIYDLGFRENGGRVQITVGRGRLTINGDERHRDRMAAVATSDVRATLTSHLAKALVL